VLAARAAARLLPNRNRGLGNKRLRRQNMPLLGTDIACNKRSLSSLLSSHRLDI